MVSIALFGLFSLQPPLLLASLFAVWVATVYGMSSPRYAYAWTVFGFTTAVILTNAMVQAWLTAHR